MNEDGVVLLLLGQLAVPVALLRLTPGLRPGRGQFRDLLVGLASIHFVLAFPAGLKPFQLATGFLTCIVFALLVSRGTPALWRTAPLVPPMASLLEAGRFVGALLLAVVLFMPYVTPMMLSPLALHPEHCLPLQALSLVGLGLSLLLVRRL